MSQHSVFLIFLLFLPLLPLGYGTDNDSYMALEAGQELWTNGVYHPSRRPGPFLYESIMGLLSRLDGCIATNAFSLFATVVVAVALFDLCQQFGIRNRQLIVLCMLVQPWNAIAATTSMDYMPALACSLVAGALFVRGRYVLAGLAGGFAIGFRISSFLIMASFLAVSLIRGQKITKSLALGTVLCTVTAILFYIPPFLEWGFAMFTEFPQTHPEAFTFPLRIAKAAYRNLSFFGLFPFVFLVGLFVLAIRRRSSGRWNYLAMVSILVIVSEEVLLVRLPYEASYLIPCLAFGLLLIGLSRWNGRVVWIPLIALFISYDIFDVGLAIPNHRDASTGARIGLFPGKGPFLQTLESRPLYAMCSTFECWKRLYDSGVRR